MELSGPKLALRYPSDADVPALFALGADPAVTRYFSWGPYAGEDEPRRWVRRMERERAEGSRLELLVVDASQAVLGVTGLSEFARRDRRCVLGSWLTPAVWGTGVNAEAKALVLHLAFAVLGSERVGAYASVDNARSRAALAKLGFAHEGVLRAFHRHRGELRDVAVLSLLRPEWERSDLRAAVPVTRDGEPPPAFYYD